MDLGLLHAGTLAASAVALVTGCFGGDGSRRGRVVACDALMIAAMLGAMLAPSRSALVFVLLVAGALLNAAIAARAARGMAGGRWAEDGMQSLAMILMAGLIMASGSHSPEAGPAGTGSHPHGPPGSLVPVLVLASAVFALLSIGAARACFRTQAKRDGTHHASMGVAVLVMGAGILL